MEAEVTFEDGWAILHRDDRVDAVAMVEHPRSGVWQLRWPGEAGISLSAPTRAKLLERFTADVRVCSPNQLGLLT